MLLYSLPTSPSRSRIVRGDDALDELLVHLLVLGRKHTEHDLLHLPVSLNNSCRTHLIILLQEVLRRLDRDLGRVLNGIAV